MVQIMLSKDKSITFASVYVRSSTEYGDIIFEQSQTLQPGIAGTMVQSTLL